MGLWEGFLACFQRLHGIGVYASFSVDKVQRVIYLQFGALRRQNFMLHYFHLEVALLAQHQQVEVALLVHQQQEQVSLLNHQQQESVPFHWWLPVSFEDDRAVTLVGQQPVQRHLHSVGRQYPGIHLPAVLHHPPAVREIGNIVIALVLTPQL